MARNLNRRPSLEGAPLEAQVMDIYSDEELGEDVPLESRCYMTNTKQIRLAPEHLAGYTCRWIHFASANPSFDQFTVIVEDLMRDYGEERRRAVQDGLRRFRARNEVRGSHGPTFRPAFATFEPNAGQNNDDWRDVDGRCHYSHEIPAFYSLPTIHFETTFDTPGLYPPFPVAKPYAPPIPSSNTSSASSTRSSVSSSSPSPPPHPPSPADYRLSSASDAARSTSDVQQGEIETHSKKSLLQYNYKFGKDTGVRQNLLLSNHLSEVSMEPTVHETWCLAVDEKNLVTVSRLSGGEIWPRGIHSSPSIWDKVPNCLCVAVRDYFNLQDHLGRLDGWLAFSTLFPGFSLVVATGVVAFAVIFDLISLVIPLFWIPGYIPTVFLYLSSGSGTGLSRFLQMASVVLTLLRTAQNHHTWRRLDRKRFDKIVKWFTRFLRSFGFGLGAPFLQLASPALARHMRHWIEVEEKMRSQEDPPEEVFKAIRRLWIIVLHFSANFFADPDGKLYRLRVHCVERRVMRSIRKGIKRLTHKMGIGSGKPHDIEPNRIRISESPRKKGETLQDLETEFLAALDNLQRQLTLVDADIESINRSENRQMLRGIHKSGRCPAMYCMLRMCTITTPTRFVIASRDISDLYARRISQEEFLVRDSVTQSLVYLISDTEDELRILKGILNSQQKVIDQVARHYAKILVGGHENQPDRRGGSRKNLNTFQAPTDSLQQRAHLKHDILMGEIQAHEEAIARLKAQSALLIGIKTERQEVAIFVFTLVTIIFLPLSFVTSYLGMNTIDIRDMEAGQGLFWTIAGPLTVLVLFISWLIARRGPTWKIYRQRKRLRDVEDWKWRYRD